MRKLPLGLAASGGLLALALAGPLRAQNAAAPDSPADNDTAYTALRLMAKTLGRETLDHVAEVTGRDGKPQPSQWKIILRDAAGDGSREVDVAGGKVTAHDPEPRPPAAKGLIHLPDLNLDSSGAFDATDAQARKVRLRFDSVNYVLRTSEATGKPQWALNLLNQEGTEVGTMRLAANDGNIVSIDGRLASGPPPVSTPTPAVAASPHRSVATVTTTRTTPPVTASSRPKESVATTTHTTTTITTVGNPPPPPPPPVATITDTVNVEDAPVDRGEGGLFTRTGRTLDKTSRTVETTLRKTGSRLQRFFTGHLGSDQDEQTPPPPPPPPPRDPDYRGD